MKIVTIHTALGEQEESGHSMTLGTGVVRPVLTLDSMGDKVPTVILARKILESKGNGSDPERQF